MIEKIKSINEHFNELSKQLTDPLIISDTVQYAKLMREHKNLTPLIEKYHEYLNFSKSHADCAELLSGGQGYGDDDDTNELKELAAEEMKEAAAGMKKCAEEMKILLLPTDENDDKNVIVEIRSGAGGEEASLFAAALYRMYTMYAESKGFRCEVLNLYDTELGGIKEISFLVNGSGAFSRYKFESGVHRVQRVPETESGGRIHTSTVTVAILPEAEDVEFEINPTDLQIDTFRASGAGGQHVNKTESAIRITHLPTGVIVECQDERSQYKNKDKAMKILRARLVEAEREKQAKQIASERKTQVGTGDRSERIRTYNYPQGRVTDHRIGLTLYKLEQFLNGSMDEVIDSLITDDRAKRLSNEQPF